MYMRHYTPAPGDGENANFELPKNYAGHLFHTPGQESDTPPSGETENNTPAHHENPFSPPPFRPSEPSQEPLQRENAEGSKQDCSDEEESSKKAKSQPVFGWFDKTFGKLKQKEWFSPDLIILAIAVFLLCDDDGDDDVLPLLLLLFFIK